MGPDNVSRRRFSRRRVGATGQLHPGTPGGKSRSYGRIEVRVMRWADKLWLRFRSLLRRRAIEKELDAELRFHLEQQIEENLASGMAPEEARYAARRSVGRLSQIKEDCRDMRHVNVIMSIFQDLRYAARLFRRSPVFTI